MAIVATPGKFPGTTRTGSGKTKGSTKGERKKAFSSRKGKTASRV